MGDFDINEIKKSSTGKVSSKKRSAKDLLTKITVVLLVLTFAAGGLVIYGLKYANDPDKLTIGYSTEETFALISIAENKGYFSENGVETEYRKYKTDTDVLESLDEDKIDVAVVEDIEFATTLPPQRGQKVLASITSANSYFFILDVKKGLLSTQDLIGRILGFPDTVGADFWLTNGLSSRREVEIKQVKLEKLAEEFANAKVDAVFAKQPYIYQTENFERSGVQALKVDGQSGKRSHTIMVMNEDFLEREKEEVKDFLGSLYEAEVYYKQEGEDIEEQLTAMWGLERRYVRNILADYDYHLALDPSLKETLSSQYQWSSQKSRRSSQTDFVLESIFYYPLLREVKPEGVEF